jgi:translation initiation factor 2 gamma subunit (eIF-2gamma)
MNRKFKMKTVNKIAISVATVMGLGLAVAYAQPGPMGGMGNGMGPGMMRGQMMQGQMMGQNANMKIMRDLMTPAERLAMMDKMIDAKTVEERQAIMTATHTEMEKRAKEKGITLPAGHGPQMMSGRMCG